MLISIPISSYLVLAKEITHFQTREQPLTCILIHNVDKDEEEEE
jgi:hypothetical protein